MDARTDTPSLRRRMGLLVLGGWSLFGLAYLLIFEMFGSSQYGVGWQRALINTVPAALLSYPFAKAVESGLVNRPWPLAAVGHVALAILFSLLWYIGVQVGYGLQSGWASTGITGRPLLGPAIIWQVFQGLTLYVAIAGMAYAGAFRLRIADLETELAQARSAAQAAATAVAKPHAVPPQQVLVKDGRALKPVEVSDILALSGAGDYVEVHTRTGTHLSSTGLNAFESELPGNFARVHRSHIVRMDAVIGIEPAGNGRLTLHLPRGLSITTSRAGARTVRERAV